MSERMAAALAAYDLALAETGIPAAGVAAAAIELDMPMADALNALLGLGAVAFEFLAYKGRPDSVRLTRR